MKEISREQAIGTIRAYLENTSRFPFFAAVDSSEDRDAILNAFQSLGQLRVSAFCAGEDDFPNLDLLVSEIQAAPPIGTPKNRFLLGLGEYAALTSNFNLFGKLKDLPIPGKLVILCRQSRNLLANLIEDNRKFTNQVCFVTSESDASVFSIIRFPMKFHGVGALKGFKKLLEHLESNGQNEVGVLTDLPIQCVQTIQTAFDCVCWKNRAFLGQREWLSEEQWDEFRRNPDLNDAAIGSWRQFLSLKLKKSSNSYLNFAAESSSNAEQFQKLIFTALLAISPENPRFSHMYAERKSLLKNVTDGEISGFLAECKVKGKDRLFYLTDQTKAERQEMIESLKGLETFPENLKDIYPDLHFYLNLYAFPSSLPEDLRKCLNRYFDEYKRQKVSNQLFSGFLEEVLGLAKTRPFNALPTRGSVLGKLLLDHSRRTFLLWVDALGVEYLSFFQSLAQEKNLGMKTYIVRAELPTITSQNSDFFYENEGVLPEENREKEDALDRLKHEGEGNPKTAGYLAEELRILKNVFDRVVERLGSQRFDRVLLVSDHGASRLAVLNGQENHWEMESKGKHCGRCCLQTELDEQPESAAEGNGFWALANYDRFRGGRKGVCEVHGGAALEEVVIPLIEFQKMKTESIHFELKESKIKVGLRMIPEISFFCARPLENVSLKVAGKFYDASPQEENWFHCVFSDLKQPEKYVAFVYENDSCVGNFEFEIVKEGVKKNDFFAFKRKDSQ